MAAAPRHQGLFRGAMVPRTPAFNEADIGDKPFFLRPVLRSPEAIRSLDAMHGERLR